MSKLNRILLVIVIILLIALGVVIYWQRGGFEKPYWAVYLSTGDLYFGKLNRFPKLSLSDVYYIQRNPNDQQNPLSLAKFNQAFWGPEDKIYLNEDNIVWKTKLRDNSQILQVIKNSSAFQAPTTQPTSQPTSQQPISQPTPQQSNQPNHPATTTQQ